MRPRKGDAVFPPVRRYGDLARGGKPVDVPGYPGKWVERPDGTRVGIRQGSRSGGATIDIRLPDGSTQKVHVE